MKEVLQIPDDFYGHILTPGRTDKKINKTEEHEVNEKYRSYVGSLNWLTMGLRYLRPCIYNQGTVSSPKRTYKNSK
jgi:hypothetical protein